MARLLDDLQTLSTAEAGVLRLHRERVDPAALAQDAAAAFRSRADRAGVGLDCRAAGPVPEVDVDPVRIGEVLANLLTNAIRHTPSGGSVRVVVEPDPGRRRLHRRRHRARDRRPRPAARVRPVREVGRLGRGRARAGHRQEPGRGARRPDHRRERPRAGDDDAVRAPGCGKLHRFVGVTAYPCLAPFGRAALKGRNGHPDRSRRVASGWVDGWSGDERRAGRDRPEDLRLHPGVARGHRAGPDGARDPRGHRRQLHRDGGLLARQARGAEPDPPRRRQEPLDPAPGRVPERPGAAGRRDPRRVADPGRAAGRRELRAAPPAGRRGQPVHAPGARRLDDRRPDRRERLRRRPRATRRPERRHRGRARSRHRGRRHHQALLPQRRPGPPAPRQQAVQSRSRSAPTGASSARWSRSSAGSDPRAPRTRAAGASLDSDDDRG